MNRILNILNDNDMDSNTQAIINGQLNHHTLLQKVREFSQLQPNDQTMYMVRLNERIRQITQPNKMLTVMVLVDALLKANDGMTLPSMQFSSLREGKTKEEVVFHTIIKYYDYFLRLNNSNRYNRLTMNAEEQLFQAEQFCEFSILKILQFLKIDFVFVYGAKLMQFRDLLREVVASVLGRFGQDLAIVTIFVKNNSEVILQKTIQHPLVFHINYIYQKLILINRNLNKLEKIARMYNSNVLFPKYEVDLDLNRKIQFEMKGRQQERKFVDLKKKGMEQYDCCLDEVEIKTTESFLLLRDEEQE